MNRPAGLWEMVKLPIDLQRTKESSDGCQRSSSSQVDVFKAFSPAMAGESHGRAARGEIFGDAVQAVDGMLSSGRMGGAWRSNGARNGIFPSFWARSSEWVRAVFDVGAGGLRRGCRESRKSLLYRANLPPARRPNYGSVPFLGLV